MVQTVRVRAWAKQRGGGGERQEKERSSRSALAALNEGLTLETSDFESLYGENLHYRLSWYNQIIFHCPPLPLHWRNTAVSLQTCLLRSKNASRWHLQKNNRIFVHSACPRFNELSVLYLTKRYTVNRGRFTVLTAASLPFIFVMLSLYQATPHKLW